MEPTCANLIIAPDQLPSGGVDATATLPYGVQADELRVEVDDGIDRRLARFAESHHGLIHDEIARRLGLTPKARQLRFDAGRLVRVHRNVLRIGGAPVTTDQRLLAACWSNESLTVVSHRSATARWGVDLGLEPVIEVSMHRPHAPSLEGVEVHRSLDFADDHWTDLGGLPVTTPARTVVDLGAVVPWWLVERALEAFNARRLVTLAQVQALREQLSEHGRSGVGVAGEVLERRGLGDRDSQSVLESRFAQLLRDHDVGEIVYQHPVTIDGRLRVIDFAVPACAIAFELKGYERHSQWRVFNDDCVRSTGLQLHGWTVIEFTWEDVVHHPGYVLRVVRESIRRAAA